MGVGVDYSKFWSYGALKISAHVKLVGRRVRLERRVTAAIDGEAAAAAPEGEAARHSTSTDGQA